MASNSSNIDSNSKSNGFSNSSKLSIKAAAPSPDSPSSSNNTNSKPHISPSAAPPSNSSSPPSSSPPSPTTTSTPPPSSSPPPPPEAPPPASSPPQSSPPPSPPPSSPPPSSSPPPTQSPPPQAHPPPPPKSESPPPPEKSSPPSSTPTTPPPSPPPPEKSPNSSPPPTPVPPNNSSASGNETFRIPSAPPPTTVSPPDAISPPDTLSPPPPPLQSPGLKSGSATRSSGTSSSSSSSSSSGGGGSGGNSQKYIGYGVGGVFAFILLALIIVCLVKKNRKRKGVHATPYGASNFFPRRPGTEGLYYAQPPGIANYAQEGFYNSQIPISPNYGSGSQRGVGQQLGGPDSGPWSAGQISFSYEQIMEITQGFSGENIIGEGGFGRVYKGWLSSGKAVAVKQLKAGSGQGEREFRAEVEIISRVHHRHLVSLVGYCIADQRKVLIYEFVPNKTLEHHLHARGVPVLDWGKRMKIAIGSAKGLAYLHEDCNPKIIHRDIKSANILLDDAYEAQVADFGLARLTDDANTHVSTRVMGTFGYMAPEYATSGKLTDRSDVFSFGVVLLELITGRKPVDQTRPVGEESLVEWARPLLRRAIETRDFSELVDARLDTQFVESEMCRMIEAAAACVRHSAPKRPRMIQVVRALDSQDESCDLSNGVKYGQSTIYDPSQYSDDMIMKFRKMATGSCGESEFDMNSGEYTSSSVEFSGQRHVWSKGYSTGESVSSFPRK